MAYEKFLVENKLKFLKEDDWLDNNLFILVYKYFILWINRKRNVQLKRKRML